MFNFFYHIIGGSISKRMGAILFFIVNLNETRAIIGSKSGKGGKLMDEKWQQLKEWIQESQYIVFFGGAGVSTESKIPDFRSEDGLYRQKYKYPPETIISHSFYICLLYTSDAADE